MNDGVRVPPAGAGLIPLTLQARGLTGTVVGRAPEVSALRSELDLAASGQLAAISLEGEPGIGKSRLLVLASEIAAGRGFRSVAVTADEELRGPFLVARSIFGAAAQHAAGGAAADVRRALDAITGRDDPSVDSLSPDEKVLRAFDLGAVAIRSLAAMAPLALHVDDLQWADDDSVRMLRYVVRSVVDSVPLFLAMALRPEEAAGTEAALLLADMERMGTLRRLQLARLTQTESAELLRDTLGGGVEAASAATIHAQSEGVPFILREVARTYRDTGLIQQIDGTWRLARHAERLVPSAVRTLIHRRAAHLPGATRVALAEAAVLGRSFSLRDLAAVKEHLGDDAPGIAAFAEHLSPAVAAGLLLELPAACAADYRFAHEQVQELAAETLTLPRRRDIHRALVELLSEAGPTAESLPILARHALEAGDADRAARLSIDAASAALAARAPEEALRIVDLALPTVSTPQDRVVLLTARDDALGMLRRPGDRIDGLAELAALAEALGDPRLELATTLRRAAAMRLSGEEERAVELAEQVRAAATEQSDREIELEACLELGQAHLRKPLGESFAPSSRETDLQRAEEAFRCACDLARELDDRAALAAATRELGVIAGGRARAWFVEYKEANGLEPLIRRVAEGERVEDIIAELEVAELHKQAAGYLEQAIELFEQLGDRRGMMSSIIALAYQRFGPDIHLHASAKRIEEIRHLATQFVTLSRESERDRAEAQMLYGVHVFARAKVVPDLALSRGAEAFDKAHLLGDRVLEFLAAGGVAMVHLELDGLADARCWIDRAAAAAAAAPSPFKARQLALWRASCLATAGESALLREELQRAVELADAQRRPAARCEALARAALESAQLGARSDDAALLDFAQRAAAEAKALLPALPGHPLWGAQADAALVRVALARDDPAAAAQAARDAIQALTAADLEDLNPDIRLAAGLGLMAGGTDEEREAVRAELRTGVMLVAQRILDEGVRVRWFTGPLGRELTELVGSLDPFGVPTQGGAALRDDDVRLLRLLVEGRTNREMAHALGLDPPALDRRLVELYARTGSASRAEATTFAFRERVI